MAQWSRGGLSSAPRMPCCGSVGERTAFPSASRLRSKDSAPRPEARLQTAARSSCPTERNCSAAGRPLSSDSSVRELENRAAILERCCYDARRIGRSAHGISGEIDGSAVGGKRDIPITIRCLEDLLRVSDY